MIVEHLLRCRRLGEVKIVIPPDWPENYGFVMMFGEIAERPLVRIQSRCAYGEVFGSMHCDCREQLDASCELLRAEGGLLFYLDQEGRGAGTLIKARAYMEWEQNRANTFDFYESIGLPPDLRDYSPVVRTITAMGFDEIRLVTSNPAKLAPFHEGGIDVERVGLDVALDEAATPYLSAKRARGYLP